ncbi:MAG: translation initiation factor IF-3, partial [Terriglobales bacterium]
MIDDEGKQIGILQPFEALKMAREKNLDLVEVSPTAQPPVCRIMDFGKYLYEQDKKERAAKKHQKVITVKEVKFRINVD